MESFRKENIRLGKLQLIVFRYTALLRSGKGDDATDRKKESVSDRLKSQQHI
ncbi:MAG: hypothetical protein IKT02_07750 [Bacteroidales bacterium]|nr:hypothetical protein [Bacteroidales bacterium]